MIAGFSGRARSGREELRQGRKWSGGHSALLEVIRGPSGGIGSGQVALRQGWKWSEWPPGGWEWSGALRQGQSGRGALLHCRK